MYRWLSSALALIIAVEGSKIMRDSIMKRHEHQDLYRCASVVGREYFWRPEYVPILLALSKSADDSINRLARDVAEFGSTAIILKADDKWKIGCENFIIITDDALTFKDNVNMIPREYYNYSGRIIIVVECKENAPLQKVHDVIKACWELKMVNVVVVAEIAGQVTLYTYFPYKENNCGNADMAILGNCANSSIQSDYDSMFPPKTMNMYKCPVRVTIVPRYPYAMVEKSKKGEKTVAGIDGNMVMVLSELMNYTVEVQPVVVGITWGQWNGKKWNGVSGDLLYNKTDIGIGAHYPSLSKVSVIDFSFGYDTTEIVWTIPRLERFSSAVKLFLPFKKYVWCCTIVTFFLVIGVLYYLRIKIDNKCLEANQLILSVWQVTLGLGLKQMPPGRFVCYIYSVWIWMSLVLRSIYQGSLVGFMTTTYYDNSLNNMRNLLDANFEFFGTLQGQDLLRNVTDTPEVREIYKKMNVLNVPEFEVTSLEIAKGNILGATLQFRKRVPDLNHKYRDQKGMFVIVKETYRCQIVTLALVRRSPLIWSINEYVLRISEAGFVDKWVEDYAIPNYKVKDDPTILALHHVFGAYILLFVGLGFSVLAFLVEIWIEKHLYIM